MKKKVLITGITGFAGSFLAEHLLQTNEYEIIGTHVSDKHLQNIAGIQDNIQLARIDLLDKAAIEHLVQTVRPDAIFHLAAFTHVAKSFVDPVVTIMNNIASQINVCEAVRQANLPETKIIIISSSHTYGLVAPEDLPITEDVRFNPDNPYSVSKIAQDYLGLQYFNAYNMKIIRLRPFNHIGPRLSADLAVSRFARTIVEVEKGKREPTMGVGNLEAKRDFTDVRDIVRAYALALDHCKEGDAYNIGSGVSHKMEDILQQLLDLAKVKITVTLDQTLLRPSDIPDLVCDATKFRSVTNWKPEISLEQSLQDTLDYWRKML